MKFIKQHGLERTGTNYIKALIESNIKDVRVLSNLFGLKHEKYNKINYKDYNFKKDKNVLTDLTHNEVELIKKHFTNDELYYIITIKNPYSWVISYNNCKWIKPNRGPLNEEKIIRYMDRWNKINDDWLKNLIEGKSEKTFSVMYEDLLLEPNKVITSISKKFDLEEKDVFNDINNTMHPGPDFIWHKNISKNKFDKKKYYLNKTYLKELPEKYINLIESKIDTKIMEKTDFKNEK